MALSMDHLREKYTILKCVLSDFTDLELGLDMVVVSARSPFSMVMHRADKVFQLEEIEVELRDMYVDLDNRYPEKPYPKNLEKYRCYSLYSPKKRRWLRARATEDVGPVHMHRMTSFELVDYADMELLPANHARYILDDFCVLPEMGYTACLNETQPDPWPTRESDCSIFRNLVVGKEFYCLLMSQQCSKDKYHVCLYDAPEDDDMPGESRECNEANQIHALPASAYALNGVPGNYDPAPVLSRRRHQSSHFSADSLD